MKTLLVLPVFVFMWYSVVVRSFNAPQVTFKLLKPTGFSMSIPGDENIKAVAMTVQVDEPIPVNGEPHYYHLFVNDHYRSFAYECPNILMSEKYLFYYRVNITLLDDTSLVIEDVRNSATITEYKRLM